MKIGVLGAGAIGCYVGGRLIAAGEDVVLVGRLGAEVEEHGLTVSDYTGERITLPPERVVYRADAGALADRDVVLVSVKSTATEEAGRALSAALQSGGIAVSLQNGIGNADVLRRVLPRHTVLAGMVPYNVLRRDGASFHRATSGRLAIERAGGAEAPIVAAFLRAGLEVEVRDDMAAVQWTKLLFNLNNSINALAGVPLREELSDRRYRRVLALSMREGLACLKAAGLRPVRVGRMIPSLAPFILSLPDALFFRVAGALIKIDPEARSSMWEDLVRGRRTEIDELNGEVLRLAERLGLDAPVNRRIRELVKAAEESKKGSPRLAADELERLVGCWTPDSSG